MREVKSPALLASLLLAASLAFAASADAAEINVVVDQARLEKLPDGVATLVIGNPLIADVSLQPGGLMVITGKGYGSTNLIALNRAGGVLMESSIQVSGPRNGSVVVVYRGMERESYSCLPLCERRITLGDSGGFFDATLAQSGTRNSSAAGAAK